MAKERHRYVEVFWRNDHAWMVIFEPTSSRGRGHPRMTRYNNLTRANTRRLYRLLATKQPTVWFPELGEAADSDRTMSIRYSVAGDLNMRKEVLFGSAEVDRLEREGV